MRKKLLLALKIFLGTCATIIALIVIILCAIVWILTPKQLTPIAEKYANEYLNANVKIGRVELTVWSSFPYAMLDVEDVEIVSKSLNKLSPEQKKSLPAYADSLASFNKFHIGLNLAKLAIGKIDLEDIMFDSPRINLVAYSDSIANYNILPPSEGETKIPPFYINSIEITRCRGINYYSTKNSLELNMGINAMQLARLKDGKNYHLIFDGSTTAEYASSPLFHKIPFNIDGVITCDFNDLKNVKLNKWKMTLLDTPIQMDLAIDLATKMTVNKFNMSLGPLKLMSLLAVIPDNILKQFKNISSNIEATLNVNITKPYIVPSSELPSFDINVLVPESYFVGPNGGRLDKINLEASAKINGKMLNSSVISLNKLIIGGKSLDILLKGKVSNVVVNPKVDGDLRCNVNIQKALKIFEIPLPYKIMGNISADTKFKFNMNSLKKKQIQNMNIEGNMALKNFHFVSPKDSFTLYAHNAKFRLDTQDKIKDLQNHIVSILSAKLTVDTISANYQGLKFNLKNGLIGAGMKGDPAKLLDRSKITPIGGTIRADYVNVLDVDSSTYRLKEIETDASVVPYKDMINKPDMKFMVKAKRILAATKNSRISMRDGEFDVNVTPKVNRINHRIDSLSKLYPQMSRDSLLTMMRHNRRTSHLDSIDGEKLDLSVDSKLKQIISRWNLKGSLNAKRVRLFTPYFPLKNRISDLDMAFSLDSVIVRNANYKVGNSKFNIAGGIRNMRTTMTGKNRRPLYVYFNILSDTLDVNELIKASFAGSAYAQTAMDGIGAADITDEGLDKLQKKYQDSADTTMAAIIIPENLDVDIDFMSKYGVYADMTLRDLEGCIQLHDGALKINDVRTSSDVGNISLDALYAAQNKQNIRFAFDLGLESIQLDRFIKLLPEVDSIMPLLNSMDGVINAQIAATTSLDSAMNVVLPTLSAAMKLRGDSLVLFDSETFGKVAKMLRFKNKKRNLIDNMTVELLIKDSQLELFPFTFMMDRYKLGVMGRNDMALNLNYHISVLESPIPFKFGLNITGNADHMKFRLGKARYKEGRVGELTKIVDDTRINLKNEIERAFKRGAHAALSSRLSVAGMKPVDMALDTLSHEDSVRMIKGGIIDAPPVPLTKKQLKAKEKAERKAAKEADKRKKQEEKDIKEQNSKAVRKDLSFIIFEDKKMRMLI